MPLNPNAGISENIREFHTGKTFAKTAAKYGKERANKQAIAVAYATQRRGHAAGGVVGYDDGGAVQSVIQALSAGSGSSSSTLPTSTTGAINTTNTASPSSPTQTQATNVPTGVLPPAPAATANPATNTVPPVPQNGVVNNPIATPLLATGGVANRDAGGFSISKSPHLSPSWETRAASRQLMHGPILSAVPGRTDNHAARVASNSYVLPAQHVASMGQGNSVAGLAAANSLFGRSGPYGAGLAKIPHGPGAPRPPRPMKALYTGGGYSEGGSRGDNSGYETVPVNVAGGEYIIHPEVVKAIGNGNLKHGHAILDAYVMHERKKDIKTIQKLPPPAKK